MTLDDYIAWISGTTVDKLNSSGGKDALTMNAIGAGINAGTSFLGALQTIRGGAAAKDAADYQATQLRQNAGTAEAVGQRQALDVDQQTAMIQSRALAVAAASGGGASDPGVINIMAQNAAEGAYRKAMALYNGEDKARLLNMQADATEYEGKVAKSNAMVSGALQGVGGVANLMTSRARGASLYQRFGGGGPASQQTSAY